MLYFQISSAVQSEECLLPTRSKFRDSYTAGLLAKQNQIGLKLLTAVSTDSVILEFLTDSAKAFMNPTSSWLPFEVLNCSTFGTVTIVFVGIANL